MRTIYQIRRENQDKTQEVVFETTRKYECERFFSRLFSSLKKGGFNPVWVREGYFIGISFEYFICKAPQE